MGIMVLSHRHWITELIMGRVLCGYIRSNTDQLQCWCLTIIILIIPADAMRAALQNGPVIAQMYISEDLFGWDPS